MQFCAQADSKPGPAKRLTRNTDSRYFTSRTYFYFNRNYSSASVNFINELLPAMLVVIKGIMPLQLEQHQSGGVTVLRISKKFVGEPDSAYLLVDIDQLIASGKKDLLLNLRELTEIDNAGLGALAEAHAKVTAADGVIKIVNAAQRHIDLLILSQLAPLFPSFNDEDEAVKSFAPEPKPFDILEFVREVNEEEQGQQLGADGNSGQQPTPEQR
ncbi:MAG: STAS domain-containing protein [Acidobacteriaceae bacterium]|nr:STAS domain-containing protein [Acidobacteriaceae bacterium]